MHNHTARYFAHPKKACMSDTSVNTRSTPPEATHYITLAAALSWPLTHPILSASVLALERAVDLMLASLFLAWWSKKLGSEVSLR